MEARSEGASLRTTSVFATTPAGAVGPTGTITTEMARAARRLGRRNGTGSAGSPDAATTSVYVIILANRVVGVSIARGADHTRAEEIYVLHSSAGTLLEAPPWSLGAE